MLLALATLLLQTAAPDTTRYTFLLAGHAAGVQTSWTTADGARHFFFEFNDRGRGPRLTEDVTLRGGVPSRLAIAGHAYFKDSVDELFDRASDSASWRNQGEQGGTRAPGSAFYVSFNGTPEETALLATALLAAPDHRLPLLPAGEASIERVDSVMVSAHGETRAVIFYLILGLDLSPTPVWLDASGAFFGGGVPGWFFIVPSGWEPVVPLLEDAQERAAASRRAQLARTLAHKPAAAFAIRHGRLFDAESKTVRPEMTIVVTGNRISAVGPDRTIQIPAGAEVIDAAGKTVLPGLWDMHVHLSANEGLLHLAAGVTTVRDMANDIDRLRDARRGFDTGTIIGPRVIMAGFIDGPGPYEGPSKVLVSSVDSARAWVNRYDSLGYEQIKLYSSLDTSLVRPIAAETHRLGLRLSGHVPAFMTAEQAVQAGYDEIQHANFLFLNFWADSFPDTRGPVRFTAVAQHAAELDLNSPRVERFVRLLQEHHTVIDATLNVFEDQFVARPGQVAPDYAAIADRMPPQVRRRFLAGGLPVPPGMDQRYRDSCQAMLRLIGMLYRAGIRIEAGTDAFPGFALHRELELDVAAGIPTRDVLQLATLGAARIMKHDRDLGSVAPGKLADLIVVNGDPVRMISDIRRTEIIVKDGVVYRAADLYRAVGVRP